jgi:D-hexose-6-phosphate mutarotase
MQLRRVSDNNCIGGHAKALIVTWRLKARIVVREETSIVRLQQPKHLAIAKQRIRKHVFTANDAESIVTWTPWERVYTGDETTAQQM